MNRSLSPPSETLRQQIKEKITDAVPKRDQSQQENVIFYEEDKIGNRAYGGSFLESEVPYLVKGMELGKVCGLEHIDMHLLITRRV